MRQTVRFADGIGELLQEEKLILLEVGPGSALSSLAKQHPAKSAGTSCSPRCRIQRIEFRSSVTYSALSVKSGLLGELLVRLLCERTPPPPTAADLSVRAAALLGGCRIH